MTAIKNLGFIILIVGVGFVVVDMFGPAPEIIDRTDYFRGQNDSLKTVVETVIESNMEKDLLISQIQNRFDSMVQRENKIHIFYANDRKKLFTDINATGRLKLFNSRTGY